MKAVLRTKRTPRVWGKKGTWSLCDNHGVIFAQVYVGNGHLSISHLDGVTVNLNHMNGMGQYRLGGEPDKPFSCPSCGKTGSKYEKGPNFTEGSVVCKHCGASFFPEEAEA